VLFADNCLVFPTVKNDQNMLTLQNDLLQIKAWTELNGMRLNGSKSQFITFGKRKINSAYKVLDSLIGSLDQFKYLGVNLASREASAKAYLTYVRPILEYCPTVWHPNQIGLTNTLEMVQRNAARWDHLNFKRDFSPALTLQNLKWPYFASS